MLFNLKEKLLDIFFPRFCLNCKKEGSYICRECHLFLTEKYLICPFCHKRSFFGESHKSCKKESILEGVVSFWDYNGIIRMGIERAKEEGLFDILNEFSELSFYLISKKENERFNSFISFLKEDFSISYIPSEREFNHSKIISDNLAKIFKKKSIPLIGKKDNFFLKNKEVPKRIVLVDDFFLSGKTINECVKILKEGGAEKVWGFTLS